MQYARIPIPSLLFAAIFSTSVQEFIRSVPKRTVPAEFCSERFSVSQKAGIKLTFGSLWWPPKEAEELH